MIVYKLNRSQLASVFKRNISTIDAWLNKGMPYVEKGGKGSEWVFDLRGVIKWRERHLREELSSQDRVEIEEAKRRKIAAEASILEIALQTKRNEMILIKEVEQDIAHAYITIKQRLRTVPDRIVAELASQTDEHICRELLINEIDDALLELSQMDFDATQAE